MFRGPRESVGDGERSVMGNMRRRKLNASAYQRPIHLEILLRHALHRKSSFKNVATLLPAQRIQIVHRTNGFVDALTNESRNAVVDYFRNGSVSPCDYRCTTRQGLNHHQSEWLRPIDG